MSVQDAARHWLGRIRYEWHLYASRRKWVALARAMFWVIVYQHDTELCDQCGRRYERGFSRRCHFFLWDAPAPLWREIHGGYGGCLCPECFNYMCKAGGYDVTWVPMVCGQRSPGGKRVANSNHWLNEARDWLLMGIPDPEYPDRSEPAVWAIVRDALVAAGYELPPIDYYPAENFKLPSRSVPGAGI